MRQGKPFGAPESYDNCPVCKQEFRKCDHTWKQADDAYLRAQQRKALAGRGNDIARTLDMGEAILYLWYDGRVTWSNK